MSLALATVDESAIAETTDLESLSLEQLALELKATHANVESSAKDALLYAMRSGDLLLEAKRKCDRSLWTQWVADTGISPTKVSRYVRLAHYAAEINACGSAESIEDALGLIKYRPRLSAARSGWCVDDGSPATEAAARMRAEGKGYREIARALGTNHQTIRYWLDRDHRNRMIERQRLARERAKLQRAALKRQERDRAMKKRGGSIAEAYSLIRKAAQELDRACSELTDTEQRSEVTAALAALHNKVEDRIVRALGIESGGVGSRIEPERGTVRRIS